MVDTYTKIVLTVIAVALVALAARPTSLAIAESPTKVVVAGSDALAVYWSPIQVECVKGCRSN